MEALTRLRINLLPSKEFSLRFTCRFNCIQEVECAFIYSTFQSFIWPTNSRHMIHLLTQRELEAGALFPWEIANEAQHWLRSWFKQTPESPVVFQHLPFSIASGGLNVPGVSPSQQLCWTNWTGELGAKDVIGDVTS